MYPRNSVEPQRRRGAEENQSVIEKNTLHLMGEWLTFINSVFFLVFLRLRASAVRILG